jgi:hypothetical protein
MVIFLPRFHAYRGRPPRATRAPRRIKVCAGTQEGVQFYGSIRVEITSGLGKPRGPFPSPSPEEHDEPEGERKESGRFRSQSPQSMIASDEMKSCADQPQSSLVSIPRFAKTPSLHPGAFRVVLSLPVASHLMRGLELVRTSCQFRRKRSCHGPRRENFP